MSGHFVLRSRSEEVLGYIPRFSFGLLLVRSRVSSSVEQSFIKFFTRARSRFSSPVPIPFKRSLQVCPARIVRIEIDLNRSLPFPEAVLSSVISCATIYTVSVFFAPPTIGPFSLYPPIFLPTFYSFRYRWLPDFRWVMPASTQ